MAWWRTHKKPKSDQPTWPRTLRQLAETADWTSGIRALSPLSVAATPGGPLLRWTGMIFSIYLAYTTSAISARSGTTAGSGTVALQTFRADTGEISALATPDWRMYNFSGGNPIASGLYCVIIQILGVHWIVAVECAPSP